MAKPDLIAVLPSNYRKIALHAISVAKSPQVLMNGKVVLDYSEKGSLTQMGIRECRNFEILDGKDPILGFHDHPEEMWISNAFSEIAKNCCENGWLILQK